MWHKGVGGSLPDDTMLSCDLLEIKCLNGGGVRSHGKREAKIFFVVNVHIKFRVTV